MGKFPEELNISEDGNGSEGSSKDACSINMKTLPLKIVLFLYCGAMASVLPYLTIHMQEIGITIQETAIIYAVLPFTSFLGPPLMGCLADKMGKYKLVLIFATIANGLFHTLLLAVPTYSERRVTTPLFLEQGGDGLYLFANSTVASCDIGSVFLNEEGQFTMESRHFFVSACSAEGCENTVGRVKVQCPSLNVSGSLEQRDCAARLTGCIPAFELGLVGVTDLTVFTGEVDIRGSNAVTFWLYFPIRVLATMFMNSCFSLLDATTLAIIKTCGEAEYGKERIFSVLGFGIVSPIAGLLVDNISTYKGYTDYSAAFYVSNLLLFLNVLTYFAMKFEVEKPEDGMMKNAKSLLGYPEVVVFLAMIFVLGSMWGFVESYLFIFLKELNAPNYLLGLTLTVGSVAGIPFSYGSEKILDFFGRVNILIFAFIAYFVRFFGYSYLSSPFWCFPFEAMEAFTYHLMWIAAATYCSELAPKGLLATLTGVMGSLHYSLGKGNGAFIGGYLMGAFGTRLSFRYFGIVSGISGLIYFLLNIVWLQNVVDERHQQGSASQVKDAEDEGDDDLPNEKSPAILHENGQPLEKAVVNLNSLELCLSVHSLDKLNPL